MVAFIFDSRHSRQPWIVGNLATRLGRERVYHITLSPEQMSAQQVLNGDYDHAYRNFFYYVKLTDIHVVFRTMHEMNGGRYPRSSDPETFKQARQHVWRLAREEWLDHHTIQFSFSVNHRDMPLADPTATPSQSARLTSCRPEQKEEKQCYTFEDYYPWDEYVDLMWVTFYNRGKASANRRRLTPDKILHDPSRQTLERIKAYNKPIIIDEVATTAVYYTGEYNQPESIALYESDEYQYKDIWLGQLGDLLASEPTILGAVYFNVDYTFGLQKKLIGEADRSAINLDNGRYYQWIHDLLNQSVPHLYDSSMLTLFGKTRISYEQTSRIVLIEDVKIINAIMNILNRYFPNDHDKQITVLAQLYQKIQKQKKDAENTDKLERIIRLVYELISPDRALQ